MDHRLNARGGTPLSGSPASNLVTVVATFAPRLRNSGTPTYPSLPETGQLRRLRDQLGGTVAQDLELWWDRVGQLQARAGQCGRAAVGAFQLRRAGPSDDDVGPGRGELHAGDAGADSGSVAELRPVGEHHVEVERGLVPVRVEAARGDERGRGQLRV